MTASATGTATKFYLNRKKKTGRKPMRPVSIFSFQNESILGGSSQFIRKDSFKSPLFILVMQ